MACTMLDSCQVHEQYAYADVITMLRTIAQEFTLLKLTIVGLQAVHAPTGLAACVGEGVQLSVYDIAAQSSNFQAKGGKPNRVGNVDLAHGTAVTFLPGPTGSGAAGQQVLVGTVEHKLWLYDMRAGKRPQMDLAWGESRVTAFAPEADGGCCTCASALGPTLHMVSCMCTCVMLFISKDGLSIAVLCLHCSHSVWPLATVIGIVVHSSLLCNAYGPSKHQVNNLHDLPYSSLPFLVPACV